MVFELFFNYMTVQPKNFVGELKQIHEQFVHFCAKQPSSKLFPPWRNFLLKIKQIHAFTAQFAYTIHREKERNVCQPQLSEEFLFHIKNVVRTLCGVQHNTNPKTNGEGHLEDVLLSLHLLNLHFCVHISSTNYLWRPQH